MPIIQVTLIEGRTTDQKRALASQLTAAACESLGSSPESVRVIVYEVGAEDFSVAGVTMAERRAMPPSKTD